MTLEERLEYMAKTGMSQNADEPVHSPAASPEHKPETGGKPSGLAGLLKSLKELFHHFLIQKQVRSWLPQNYPSLL